MADQNIKITISGVNDTGRAFRNVENDLNKLKQEIGKPIPGPRIVTFDEQVAKRVEGIQRGRERAAQAKRVNDAALQFLRVPEPDSLDRRFQAVTDRSALERSARARQAEQIRFDRAGDFIRRGGALSAGELASEQNNRFRASVRASSSAIPPELASSERAFKATVIAGVVLKAAQAIGNIPQAVKAYTDSLKVGENRNAAMAKAIFDAIPFVGQFAEAGRALRGFIEDLRNPPAARSRDAKDAAQDARIDRESQRDRTNARRAALQAESGAALNSAQRAGVTDPLTLAKLERDDQFAIAAKIRQNAGAFGTTKEQDAEKEKARLIELTAQKNFEAKRVEIQNEAEKSERDKLRDHNAAVQQIQDETAETTLRNQGKTLDAQLLQIQNANKKEIEEAEAKGDKVLAAELRKRQKAQETGAKQEDLRSRFGRGIDVLKGLEPGAESTPGNKGTFGGESKLLTGVGSSKDLLLQPTKNIDKNIANLTEQQRRDMATAIVLLGQIATGSGNVVVGGVP